MSRSSPESDEVDTLIQKIVASVMQNAPEEGDLHKALIERVERELIAQVLAECGHVHVKAAKMLGINRNTLHKKTDENSRSSA